MSLTINLREKLATEFYDNFGTFPADLTK